jgi:hypothetical protein
LKKTLPSDGIYFERARPKVHETGLGPNQPPTTEHLAHRIGHVLKPFPAHRRRPLSVGSSLRAVVCREIERGRFPAAGLV